MVNIGRVRIVVELWDEDQHVVKQEERELPVGSTVAYSYYVQTGLAVVRVRSMEHAPDGTVQPVNETSPKQKGESVIDGFPVHPKALGAEKIPTDVYAHSRDALTQGVTFHRSGGPGVQPPEEPNPGWWDIFREWESRCTVEEHQWEKIKVPLEPPKGMRRVFEVCITCAKPHETTAWGAVHDYWKQAHTHLPHCAWSKGHTQYSCTCDEPDNNEARTRVEVMPNRRNEAEW